MVVRCLHQHLSSPDILKASPESLGDVEIMYLVFCIHVRRYPSYPVAWFVGEEGSANDKIVVSTVVGKEFSILIHHSKAMLSHHLFKAIVITAKLCIHIPY